MRDLIRKIKIDIIEGKYKAISAYKIPKDVELWYKCPNCGLKPLAWEFDNGRLTACGCGKNQYDHFSIQAESVMEYGKKNNFNFIGYDHDSLRKKWNNWVESEVNRQVKDGEVLIHS